MPRNEPPDWDEWVAEAESGGAIPTSGIRWIEDNYGEWADVVDNLGLSPETAILGLNAGFGDPGEIESITIHADGADWSVFVNGREIDLDAATVWDWWDLGDFEGIDVEKDIDTGEASG